MLITTGVSLLSSLSTLADVFNRNKDKIDNVVGAGRDIADRTSGVLNSLSAGSVSEITKATRIEPLVLIDEVIVNDPIIPDILKVTTSREAAYFAQALALLGNVSGMSVIGTLDRLNPNRTGYGLNELDNAPAAYETFGLEELSAGLMTTRDARYTGYLKTTFRDAQYAASMEAQQATKSPDGIVFGKNQMTDIYDVPNLAVGKHFEVTVTNNGESRVIPMTIRLLPIQTDSESIVRILSMSQNQQSMKERWHLYKAGELSFSELWSATDLIENQTRTLLRDKSGFYKEALRRMENNRKKGLTSGTPSLNTMANVIVIPDTTARRVEQEIGGTFANVATRKKIFDACAAAMIVVVDNDYGTVTFYTRGDRVPAQFSFSALKGKAGKTNDADLMDIFKALAGNRSSAF